MTKATYKIQKNNDRIIFNANGTYALLDTGFPFSVSPNGNIGPFHVQTHPEAFFYSFLNLKMPNGSKVTAILCPMDGYNCLLRQDGLTISDEEETIPEHDYFLPFVAGMDPIVEGTMNGYDCRFFFDSGARMTMFGEVELAGGKPSTGSYTEWMGMLRRKATLQVYNVALDFPCGLHYEGKSALVPNREYKIAGVSLGIRAMLGIDLFNEYDIYISTANKRRGIALIKRK